MSVTVGIIIGTLLVVGGIAGGMNYQNFINWYRNRKK